MKEQERMEMEISPAGRQQSENHWLTAGQGRRRILAALAVAFFCGSFFTLGVGGIYLRWHQQNRGAIAEKLEEIESLIDQYYLYDVDEEAAANGIASGYAGALDVYSCYRDAEAYQEFQAHNDGDLCGIGVTVAHYSEDALKVLYLLDESPASGILQAGDEIVGVEGETVESLGYTGAVAAIKGEAGTEVQLTVRRGEELLEVSVKRADVVNSGIYFQQFDQTGYLQISAFNNATPAAFEEAVEQLMQQGVTGLVFDLRNNGGGLLTSVSEMLDFLLPAGDLVSRTDKDGKTVVLYTSDDDCIDLPMAVLVNESTASAAELFACDLQEYGVATVVGTTTYGKGVMQTTYSLSDGGSLTLTTDYYNPSSGKNYNGVGVIPDIECPLTEQQQKDFVHFDPSHDPQLSAALEAVSDEKSS